MGSFIRESVYPQIDSRIATLTRAGGMVPGLASLLGLLFAFWSANGAMKAMIDALSVACGVADRRGFILYNALCLAMTAGAVAVAVAMLLALAAVLLVPDRLSLGRASETLLEGGRWLLSCLVLINAVSTLYRFGPDVPDTRWRWISPGRFLASAGVIALSVGFSSYGANIGNCNEGYGSPGDAFASMIWVWLSSAVVLVGAELNAELDRQRVLANLKSD